MPLTGGDLHGADLSVEWVPRELHHARELQPQPESQEGTRMRRGTSLARVLGIREYESLANVDSYGAKHMGLFDNGSPF